MKIKDFPVGTYVTRDSIAEGEIGVVVGVTSNAEFGDVVRRADPETAVLMVRFQSYYHSPTPIHPANVKKL